MADLAVADEDGRELHEAQIIGGRLVPTDEQAPETIAPAVRDCDDPAPGRMAVRMRGRRHRCRRPRFGRDVRGVAVAGSRFAAGGVVVAAVQTEVARDARCRWGHGQGQGIEQHVKLLQVVPLGRAADHGERDARPIGQ